MGGVMVCVVIGGAGVRWGKVGGGAVWVAVTGLVSFGAIGFWDAYTKITRKRNLGLTVRHKLALEVLAGMLIGVLLLGLNAKRLYSTEMNVPFLKNFRPDLLIHAWLGNPWTYPLAFIFFFGFVLINLVGYSNAVNLTDGLDGLAIGLMTISSGAMTALAYVSGHAQFATYLELSRTPGAGELAVFCGAMTGASVGFLWYNAHPADVFMGDVGALALGGALSTVAVLLKQELLLPFIGGVYVLEAASVIIQVVSFRTAGKRVFQMAPLH